MLNNQSGVIKSFVIALVVLIVVMNSAGCVRAVSIDPNNPPVTIGPYFPPLVWVCGYNITYNNTNIKRMDKIAYEDEKIQWKILVFNKMGINKIQEVFGEMYSENRNEIKFNCFPAETVKSGQIIDSSCNAQISDENITTAPANNLLSYYTCSLEIKNSGNMSGNYSAVFGADDISGISNTNNREENWIINPETIYVDPNPEALIKYDSSSKNLIVFGNDSGITVNETEKCLDKKCSKITENYLLTNSFGNNLTLVFQHGKLLLQDSFNLLTLQYNNDKPIKSAGKLSLIDSKSKLYIQFSNKTAWVSYDFNKKTNKTRIIKFENSRINYSLINGQYNFLFKTTNGSLGL